MFFLFHIFVVCSAFCSHYSVTVTHACLYLGNVIQVLEDSSRFSGEHGKNVSFLAR